MLMIYNLCDHVCVRMYARERVFIENRRGRRADVRERVRAIIQTAFVNNLPMPGSAACPL